MPPRFPNDKMVALKLFVSIYPNGSLGISEINEGEYVIDAVYVNVPYKLKRLVLLKV